ncbi:tryptophan synthase, alpha chain [Oceanobacillus limi]|uniref:Tryptophan synthase alpha chain n=1 Tax=Oceanobacillus limi TaxID=930131 RepID=A0A1I0CGN7_9BACI|nr:tryptophan synthase subunit alpha [Oceanobacillus limi]SET18754.1 tryptophan synthase, alpha chain [Oceanobacillus limi]
MSKEKLDKALNRTLESGQKVFIPYIMAGDGGLDSLKEQILFLQEAGVTAIEIGVPFSDPVADGPTIQEAGKRSLQHGTSLRIVLDYLKDLKPVVRIPLIVMTYLNPVFKYGIENFCTNALQSGISGVIIPDLPLEQSELIRDHLQENEIALIQLATLTSSEERMKKIAKASEGFLYAVTVNGITGERSTVDTGEGLEHYMKRIKKHSNTPVLAGFGISTPEQVRKIGAACDGVIIGSKIISLWKEGKRNEIKELIQATQQ